MPRIDGSTTFDAHDSMGADGAHLFHDHHSNSGFGIIPGDQDFYGGTYNVGDDRDASGAEGRRDWHQPTKLWHLSTRGLRFIPLVYRYLPSHSSGQATDLLPFLEFGSGAARPGVQLMRGAGTDRAWLEGNRILGSFNRGTRLSANVPLPTGPAGPPASVRLDLIGATRCGSFDTRAIDPGNLTARDGYFPQNKHTDAFARFHELLDNLSTFLQPHTQDFAPELRLNAMLDEAPVSDVLCHDFSLEAAFRLSSAALEGRFRFGAGDIFEVRRLVRAKQSVSDENAAVQLTGGIALLPHSSWTWLGNAMRYPERAPLPENFRAMAAQEAQDVDQSGHAHTVWPTLSRSRLRAAHVATWFRAKFLHHDNIRLRGQAFVGAASDADGELSHEVRRHTVAVYLRLQAWLSGVSSRLFAIVPQSSTALLRFSRTVRLHLRNLLAGNEEYWYLAGHEQGFRWELNSLLPKIMDWSWIPLGLPLSDYIGISLRAGSAKLSNTTIAMRPAAEYYTTDATQQTDDDATYDTFWHIDLIDEVVERLTRLMQTSQRPSAPQGLHVVEQRIRCELQHILGTMPLLEPKRAEALHTAIEQEVVRLLMGSTQRQSIAAYNNEGDALKKILQLGHDGAASVREHLRDIPLMTEPIMATIVVRNSESNRAFMSSPLYWEQYDLRRTAQIFRDVETRHSASLVLNKPTQVTVDSHQRIYRYSATKPKMDIMVGESRSAFELRVEFNRAYYGHNSFGQLTYRFDHFWPLPTRADINALTRTINQDFGLGSARHTSQTLMTRKPLLHDDFGGALKDRSARLEGKLSAAQLVTGWRYRAAQWPPAAFAGLNQSECDHLRSILQRLERRHPSNEQVPLDIVDPISSHWLAQKEGAFELLGEHLHQMGFAQLMRHIGALVQLCHDGIQAHRDLRIGPVAPPTSAQGETSPQQTPKAKPAQLPDEADVTVDVQHDPDESLEDILVPDYSSSSMMYRTVLARAWRLLDGYAERSTLSAEEDGKSIVLRWMHALPHIRALTQMRRALSADEGVSATEKFRHEANVSKALIFLQRLLWPPDFVLPRSFVAALTPAQRALLTGIVMRLSEYEHGIPSIVAPLAFFCGGTAVIAAQLKVLREAERATTTKQTRSMRHQAQRWRTLAACMLRTLAPQDIHHFEQEGLDNRLYPWPLPILDVHDPEPDPLRFAFCLLAPECGLDLNTYRNRHDRRTLNASPATMREQRLDAHLRQYLKRAAAHLSPAAQGDGRSTTTRRSQYLAEPALALRLPGDPVERGSSHDVAQHLSHQAPNVSLYPMAATLADFRRQHAELVGLVGSFDQLLEELSSARSLR